MGGLRFPPLISGGPIEATPRVPATPPQVQFPPLISGGPIEAISLKLKRTHRLRFPPLISGGPIEAVPRGQTLDFGIAISAADQRRPH